MLLRDIYAALYGVEAKFSKINLIELAGILSNIDRRDKPWTWRYLHGILHGYDGFSASADLLRALTTLARQLDGQSALRARLRPFSGFKANGIVDGSVIFGHSTRCPECQILFVPNPGWRIYCPECRPPRKRERS